MEEQKNIQYLRLFGKRLHKLRTEKEKISLRELAKRCDVEHSKIAKIEKGQVKIQLPTVFELAKGLDIHPKVLFDFEIPD